MAEELYKIEQEEKLSDIARRFGISEEKLKALNPNMRTFGGGFFSKDVYVGVNQVIKISDGKVIVRSDKNLDFDFVQSQKEKEATLSEEERFLKNLTFEQQARYRCEQVNVSKVDGNITGNAKQNFQYFIRQGNDLKTYTCKLEEFIYTFYPTYLNKAFEMIASNEKIKNNIVFSLNEEGQLGRILNKKELLEKWKNFKNNDFEKLEFIKHLKSHDKKTYNDLISSGDKQFSEAYNLEDELKANMFYHVFFDKHLINDDFSKKKIKYTSILFPNIRFDVSLKTEIITTNEDTFKIKIVGNSIIDENTKNKIIEAYDNTYKPAIKFSFSEYNLKFEIKKLINLKTKFIELAECNIEEEVLNNIENRFTYHIKKVKHES